MAIGDKVKAGDKKTPAIAGRFKAGQVTTGPSGRSTPTYEKITPTSITYTKVTTQAQ
mgnify:CR=1 FL=1